ncbi:hypothetical protein GA0115252_11444, partial [Streptomyces sp. DfronAA-171]
SPSRADPRGFVPCPSCQTLEGPLFRVAQTPEGPFFRVA